MKTSLKEILVKAMNDSELVSIQCETEHFVGRIFNVGPEILTISVMEAGIAHIRLKTIAAIAILIVKEMEESDDRITI